MSDTHVTEEELQRIERLITESELETWVFDGSEGPPAGRYVRIKALVDALTLARGLLSEVRRVQEELTSKTRLLDVYKRAGKVTDLRLFTLGPEAPTTGPCARCGQIGKRMVIVWGNAGSASEKMYHSAVQGKWTCYPSCEAASTDEKKGE